MAGTLTCPQLVSFPVSNHCLSIFQVGFGEKLEAKIDLHSLLVSFLSKECLSLQVSAMTASVECNDTTIIWAHNVQLDLLCEKS